MWANEAIKVILISIALSTQQTVGEELQNTNNLCNGVCKCIVSDKTYTIDCSNKTIEHTLATWPEAETNKTYGTLKGIFSHNNITALKAMPPTPPSAKSLVVFYDHCQISYLTTGLFENTVNILHADLSYNLLKSDDLHSDVFKGPYNDSAYEPIKLQYLNLAYNDIHSLSQNLFEHTPDIKYLNLEGNNFRVLDPHTISALTTLVNLEELNLANNELVHVPQQLTPLKKLAILDISKNELDFVPQAIAQVALTLHTLVVDNNPILDITDETFLGMDALMVISAKNLKSIKHIKTNAFNPLKNLRQIDLSGLDGVLIDEAAFGNISNLLELNLSNSNLKTLPTKMVKWATLRNLDLSSNQLECQCNLLDITAQLGDEIKIDKDGPYCIDSKRKMQVEMYTLTKEVCYQSEHYVSSMDPNSLRASNILRMTLLMLSLFLLVSMGFAMYFGYKKYMARKDAYPFANTVMYNPINTMHVL